MFSKFKDDKKGVSGVVIFLIILVIIVLLAIILVWFMFFKGGKNYDRYYADLEARGEIPNPSANLTVEEAVEVFDESFVKYILYSIKAYNLHNPPFSNNHPKIEFYIGDDVYNAKIEEGVIDVFSGSIDEEDIIIRTSKEEAVKMTQSKDYIGKSFQNRGSTIEMVAGNVELASKGYLDLYEELTGRSLTGLFIQN